MTLMGAIIRIDSVKPNRYDETEKIKWLSTLDGIVKKEVIDTHEKCGHCDLCNLIHRYGEDVVNKGYDENTGLATTLLIPHPYDEVYIRWLEAQIDYANGEYGKYNNSITMFNTAYTSFVNYYNRDHKPISKTFTNF